VLPNPSPDRRALRVVPTQLDSGRGTQLLNDRLHPFASFDTGFLATFLATFAAMVVLLNLAAC
jgi:hypothetical protein